MIRNILRKYPSIYGLVRNLHITLINICHFPRRLKLGNYYKKKLRDAETVIPRIWYFCVPLHNNLGDYAQYQCIKKWISDSYPSHELIEVPSNVIGYDYVGYLSLLKEKVKANELMFFQSGYTSTDLHDDEKVHRIIVKSFPNNRIVFFPQTVKYSSEKEAFKTAKIYNAHKHILFMARDNHSYKTATTYFTGVRVKLMPDIVTTLIGTSVPKQERKGVFYCIRHDSEKMFSDVQIKQTFSSLRTDNDEWGDTTLAKNEQCTPQVIDSIISHFSRYKLIVTDRFHGTIFSLVASTPVIVIPTIDHKVLEGADWFLDLYPQTIVKVNSLEEAYVKASEMIDSTPEIIQETYFKKHYYDALITTIEKL